MCAIRTVAAYESVMKAAIVRKAGQTPIYADFMEPAPVSDEIRVTVTAAALSPLVRGRAAGTHYTASDQFPFVVGFDGVGRLDDGKRAYFMLTRAPYGTMSERTVVRPAHCVAIPDGLDDVTAAAIANPGMSSWVAYTDRAKLKAGETVLVNGATGAAGRLAIQIAKHLGAKKVIATGRNADTLRSVAGLGADVTIPLGESETTLENSFEEQFADRVDVVIDYLWGKSAEGLLKAAAKAGAVPVRFVQVGASSGREITLSGATLRSSAIELMGSGLGSVPIHRFMNAIDALLKATVPCGFKIATKSVPLSDVERAWPDDGAAGRMVFTVDQPNS